MALHPAQLTALQGDRYAAWFKEHDLCLLLTHHPPEWLTAEAREEYTANIAPPGRFLAHLCGHLHVDRREDISIGGAPRPRLLRGSSLFGLESFGKGKRRIRREHGYSILRLDLDPAEATWRRWPRGGIKMHGGNWKIARNEQAEQSLEDDGGTPAEALPIKGVLRRHTMTVPAGGVEREPAPSPAPPARLEDLERLRQTFEDAMASWRRITAHIWQRLQSHVIYDGKEVDLTIEARGDTTVTSVYLVESSQTVPFVPFEIAGDETSPEVHHLDELGFQVRPVGRPKKGDEVLYLQTDNFPRRKRLALFFFPEIDARQRKIEVKYRWPGLAAKLIQQGTLDWAFGWRRPVRRGEIRFRLSAELGEVECQLVNGQGRGVTLSRHHDKDGYLVWTCRCRDAPAGDYLFTLKRTSNHP